MAPGAPLQAQLSVLNGADPAAPARGSRRQPARHDPRVNEVAELIQAAYHRRGMPSGWHHGRDGRAARAALMELDRMVAEGAALDPVGAIERALSAYLDDPEAARRAYQLTDFWRRWGYYLRARRSRGEYPLAPDGKPLY